MSDNEVEELYILAARVKNLARGHDAHLTPIGEALCNYYILVLKDFYELANGLPEPHKRAFMELILSKEDFPRKIIELGKKKLVKT